jgi:hypothetical protein
MNLFSYWNTDKLGRSPPARSTAHRPQYFGIVRDLTSNPDLPCRASMSWIAPDASADGTLERAFAATPGSS